MFKISTIISAFWAKIINLLIVKYSCSPWVNKLIIQQLLLLCAMHNRLFVDINTIWTWSVESIVSCLSGRYHDFTYQNMCVCVSVWHKTSDYQPGQEHILQLSVIQTTVKMWKKYDVIGPTRDKIYYTNIYIIPTYISIEFEISSKLHLCDACLVYLGKPAYANRALKSI